MLSFIIHESSVRYLCSIVDCPLSSCPCVSKEAGGFPLPWGLTVVLCIAGYEMCLGRGARRQGMQDSGPVVGNSRTCMS